MSCLISMNSFELIVITALIAIFLSDNQSSNELNVLGNLIVSIGSLMLTIAAQKQAKESKNNDDNLICDLEKKLEDLQKQIQKIKR
ncbi:MAG: hypothetical protein GX981_09555 [Tissierellia bacterium]|nr:hypothetical protein [Tissierellia bacterium]